MKAPISAAIRCSLILMAVAALSIAYPARANLISNGGFETGDFTGWGVGRHYFVTGTIDGVSPHSGNFQAALHGGGVLGQIVPFLTPGRFYTIDFWLANAAPPRNFFSVNWNGGSIFALANQSAFGYTEYTVNVIALSNSATLSFQSYANNGREWLLDDVSVTPAGVGAPDSGSTVSLLGCALLGLTALRRKLSC